ncbi:MAG: hypothetical protein COB38_03390 [Gammaproteobacteria bacterium]|nr:MAG: hypothetical protein COB38_03390 [Gammaproteobacteria bacterium]
MIYKNKSQKTKEFTLNMLLHKRYKYIHVQNHRGQRGHGEEKVLNDFYSVSSVVKVFKALRF